jgi:hypothetical protein
MKRTFIISIVIYILSTYSYANNFQIDINPSEYFISYTNKAPMGMVGNGQKIYLIQSGKIKDKNSNKGFSSFIYKDVDIEFSLESNKGNTSFFPGGAIYSFSKEGKSFDILHACLKDDPYVCIVRVKNSIGKVICPKQYSLKKKIVVSKDKKYTYYKFANKETSLKYSWEGLQEKSMERYIKKGMILQSSSPEINRAVAFNQYLLDLGYNEKLIVCELFRYRDIWSRDLGSGFGPGALYTNRVEAAKNCIYYDMNRYVKSTAKALKTTDDASKGGSVEGTAWLTLTLWDYYLITGDKNFLKEGANDIRPFVEAWLDRDYNEDGLIVDVTDWMDHSRHYLLPYGSTTTYSNALMVQLLNTFASIEKELGKHSDSQRYASLANRFVNGINEKLWSEESESYANLQINGVKDLRTASAANALAVLAGIANENRTAKIFKTLEKNNWKASGSMTITPPTTHIDSDQNEKIWPWWNAVEALARFQNNNSRGGLRLLENCTNTLNIDHFPGLMQEILHKNGETEGGNAFVTGAGSFLTSIYKGLLGIEIITPGMSKIRIQPNFPHEWKNLKAKLPTPNGYFVINLVNGKLDIGVFDNTIKEVEVGNNVEVKGAKAISISKKDQSRFVAKSKLKSIPISKRKTAVFYENGIPYKNRDLNFEKIGLNKLSNIEKMNYEAIVFTTNALPVFTSNGKKTSDILEKFIEKGGAIIFYGTSMKTLNGYYAIKMGLQGGVVEWYKKENNKWQPYDAKTDKISKEPMRGGTVYWGKGHYFNSWDVQLGLFGFSAQGKGLYSNYKDLQNVNSKVTEVFSDFAVSKPYYFESIADTYTNFNFMYPPKGEKMSCFCRIVNTNTKGEFILIANSICEQLDSKKIVDILKLY